MDVQQERDIARRLRDGDVDAWRMLYDAYAERVWWWIARRLGTQSSDVADVVQETFLAAARSARNYDPERGSLWGWLAGIARNHVALAHRQHQRHDARRQTGKPADVGSPIVDWLEDEQAAPGDIVCRAEVQAIVRDTLTAMPAEYELLLSARYFDDTSVEELATQHRSTTSAIRSKLARARRVFRMIFRHLASSYFEAETG